MVGKITLSTKEAATLSGIGINRMRELARRPEFPAFRDGRKILIYKDLFLEWLKQQAVEKTGFSAPLKRWKRR